MAAFLKPLVSATVLVNFVVIWAGLEQRVMGAASEVVEGVSEKTNPLFYSLQRERGGGSKSRTVVKRYPQHLDPTLLKFWIQVGECPDSPDGAKQYYCPSLASNGKQVCIDDYQLCNGAKECPNAEDEDRHTCFFYKALKSQVDLLERSLVALNSPAQKSPVRRYANSYRHSSYDYK